MGDYRPFRRLPVREVVRASQDTSGESSGSVGAERDWGALIERVLGSRDFSEPVDSLRHRADPGRRSHLRVCSCKLTMKLTMFLAQWSDDVARNGAVMKPACHQRVCPSEGRHDVRSPVDKIENIGYAGDSTFEVYNDGYMGSNPLFVAEHAMRSEWLQAAPRGKPTGDLRYRGA